MTKRAKAIQGFVSEITKLAIDATPIKMGIQGSNPNLSAIEATLLLSQCQLNMQAHLVDILENNPEQAEALMAELGINWKIPPS
jgi:hypothetical protein